MSTKRSYHDACGMAHALDVVGERWALPVVRELLLGPKRYSDLLDDLPGISTTVLARRLTELERSGVLHKRRLPPPAASQVYALTPWGRELEPVIRQLGRWGARSPAHPRDAHLSVTSLIISLRTNFTPALAEGLRARLLLHIGDDRFLARVDASGLRVDRAPAAVETYYAPGPHGGHDERPGPSGAGTSGGEATSGEATSGEAMSGEAMSGAGTSEGSAPGGGVDGMSGAHGANEAGGGPEAPAAVITATVRELAGAVYGPRPAAEAVRSGEVTVTGDRAAAERFLGAFTLPEPAAPAAAGPS